MIWSGQHAADGMASGFGMAGDAAGAAVVSKAIPGGLERLERERTGGTREVQMFFVSFVYFFLKNGFIMV